jgi:hypothetical protein
MKTAILKINSVDRMRFEVHSTPSRGHHSGVQKWYMKANHPVEASRWTQAIGKSIDWYKRDCADVDRRRKSVESDSSGLKPAPSIRSHKGSFSITGSPLKRSRNAGNSETGSAGSYTDLGSRASLGGPDDSGDASPDLNQTEPHLKILEGGDDGDRENNDDSSAAESTRRTPPHDSSFDLQGNSTAAQMELTSHLLDNLVLPPDSPPRTNELKNALKDSFAMVQGMLSEYVQMAKEREEWWAKQLEREKDRQGVWEESLAMVVKEGEVLERELRTRSRKRGSRFFDASVGFGVADGMGTIRQRPSKLGISKASPVLEESTAPENIASASGSTQPVSGVSRRTSIAIPSSTRKFAEEKPVIPVSSPPAAGDWDRGMDNDFDTDEEDEFFDAIESNTLPNLRVHESLTSPTHSQLSLPMNFNVEPYSGYRNLRTELNLSDQRPSTSLWTVLKHSIGKDLTKISFPVFFNEPTSMLQRMVSRGLLIFVQVGLRQFLRLRTWSSLSVVRICVFLKYRRC